MRTQYEFHEVAGLFPLDERSIDALADDIRTYGLQIPIELLDGKILDGRRRYLACRKAKVTPAFREVRPNDPVAHVLSLNLRRRYLKASQLAMVGARVRDWYDRQAKERQRGGKGGKLLQVNLPEASGQARDLAGKAVGVSGTLIDKATLVIKKGIPELAKSVDEGRLSVSAAASVADADEETQKEVASRAKFSGGRYRKPPIVSKPEPNKKTGFVGVGTIRAHEAINCLSRIPKNDALRKRGFQIVTEWIRRNR